jgi:hypothetical protein
VFFAFVLNMEDEFEKADNVNLPEIDEDMVLSYIFENPCFNQSETRNVKTMDSGRKEYGDEAIGYVAIKRKNNICVVKAKITPEHSISKPPYKISCVIDEKNERIKSAKCEDCAASEGGCKHAIALLFWLLRRSQDPTTTDVICYWTAPKLSSGKSEPITLDKFGKRRNISSFKVSGSFLRQVISAKQNHNAVGLKFFNKKLDHEMLFMDRMKASFAFSTTQHMNDAEQFIMFLQNKMTTESCNKIEKITTEQSTSTDWYQYR